MLLSNASASRLERGPAERAPGVVPVGLWGAPVTLWMTAGTVVVMAARAVEVKESRVGGLGGLDEEGWVVGWVVPGVDGWRGVC